MFELESIEDTTALLRAGGRTLLPLGLGLALCGLVALLWRLAVGQQPEVPDPSSTVLVAALDNFGPRHQLDVLQRMARRSTARLWTIAIQGIEMQSVA